MILTYKYTSMRSAFPIAVVFTILTIGCTSKPQEQTKSTGPQGQIIIAMIDAVNEKDAKKYVQGFSDSVKVYVESDLKVDGKESLIMNRAQHFERHPQVRSEIQHLVEIDNRVVLHDKVWLTPSDTEGQNIVEIFTFQEGKVIRVDVIQPTALFRN